MLRVAEAASPVLPVTVTVYLSETAKVGIVKDVDTSTPPISSHDSGDPITEVGVLVMMQVAASMPLKPLPEIDIVAPGYADDGIRVIIG
jgi:hypothetical protein